MAIIKLKELISALADVDARLNEQVQELNREISEIDFGCDGREFTEEELEQMEHCQAQIDELEQEAFAIRTAIENLKEYE